MGRKRSNIQIDIDLQPKQNELWDLYEFGSPTRIGAGGSRGGSKSISADYIMLMRRIKYPNTNGLFIMKVYQDMIDIHLRPMFDRFHGLEDFFDKKEMLLTLPNGSYIRFLSGDSLATFQQRKGRGFADVMVDQSELFTEEELKFLYTINRSVDPDITPKTLLCFNPGGTSHTYNKRIFLEKYFKDNEKEEDYAFVQIFGWDNAYWALKPLNEDKLTIEDYHKWDDKKRFEYFITRTEYGRNLDQLPDSQRKAELLGDFYVFEGMFFSDIRTDIHLLKEYTTKPEFKTIGGLDYGNVTSLQVLQRDYEGTIVAADECHLENYSNPTDRANEIADFLIERKLNNLRIICDTDMNSSQISNVGFDKKPIDIFRHVFNQRMGKNAPRLEFVSKSAGSLDRNKTYRAICNEAVKNYLAIHDGKARLYFSPKVKHLYDTMTQLIYDRKDPNGLDFDRSRVPKIDHCFAAGTLVATIKGEKSIEDIKIGECVLTRKGYKKVVMTHITENIEVNEYQFDNDIKIVCTPSHQFYTNERGFVPIDEIESETFFINKKEIKWKMLWLLNLIILFSDVILIRLKQLLETIIDATGLMLPKGLDICTERFGNIIMVESQKDITYITKTATPTTIQSRISNVYRRASIFRETSKEFVRRILNVSKNIWTQLGGKPLNGIKVLRASGGIPNMALESGQIANQERARVLSVERNLIRKVINKLPVRMNVGIKTENECKKQEFALFAGNILKSINTIQQKLVRKSVLKRKCGVPAGKQTVYNLTIEDIPEYYANGILVHNCYDGFKYAFMALTTPRRSEQKDPDAKKYARGRFTNPKKYASDYTFL